MTGSRAERIEFLLLHEFTSLGFIVPDKKLYQRKSVSAEEDDEFPEERRAVGGRKKPAYEGGLVLEPKRGLYDNYVVLLDFNSLYPSIIQEYNICFTTVKRPPRVRMVLCTVIVILLACFFFFFVIRTVWQIIYFSISSASSSTPLSVTLCYFP